MNKTKAAQVLGCLVEDVDGVMGQYGIKPIGAIHGRGGSYFPGLVHKVREFEDYRIKLEGELVEAINHAATHPVGLEMQVRGILKDISKSTAPQTKPDALRAFIERSEV